MALMFAVAAALLVVATTALPPHGSGSSSGGPVSVWPLPHGGGLSLSNGLVRVEASNRTIARPSMPLLRFFVLGKGGAAEVVRSFHADQGAAHTPLYSQASPHAGYRVLLHDHLRAVHPGSGGNASAASIVLSTSAGGLGSPCGGVAHHDGGAGASSSAGLPLPPPLPANCSVLASATVLISLRAGDTSFSINVTAAGSQAHEAWWVEYVLASFEWAPATPPRFVHTPHLKRVSQQHWNHAPSTEYVSADRTFNSPIVVMEGDNRSGAIGMALLADTLQLNAFVVDSPNSRGVSGEQNMKWAPPAVFSEGKYVHPSFPAGFDVQIQPPVAAGRNAVVSFGMMDYEAEQHVYFKHKNDGSMVRAIHTNQLKFGFDLQLQQGVAPVSAAHMTTDTDHCYRPFQRAAHRAWAATGSAELRRGRPQVMPFLEYAAHCYPAALNASSPVGGPPNLTADGAFVEWTLADGTRAGGLRTMAGGPNPAKSVVFDKIQNVFWWNNQHMATGFGLWGQELSGVAGSYRSPSAAAKRALGARLQRAAELTLNMTLSAPLAPGSAGGLWSSVCTWSPKSGCAWTGALHKIEVAHTAECEGNPKCDPGYTGAYWDFSSPWMSASSNSKTCVMLLRFYTDIRKDARILPRVQTHADWLVNVAASTVSDSSVGGQHNSSFPGRVPEWWAPLEPTPAPPAPSPPPAPPAPPRPPVPAGAFRELGNEDPNGLHPTGPFHVPSEKACQALCFQDDTCEVGVFLNGTVRHGECWIGPHLEPPRTDFCGAAPGQSCQGFQRNTMITSSGRRSNGPSGSSLSSVGWLDFNSHGGIHLQVLAEYAKHLTTAARKSYVSAARVIAQQLIDEILPQQRWADVETFYSCSNKPESAYDNFTKQPPRNTLSTGWAVDGLTSMYELTSDAQYLRAAEEAADYASLYQTVYEPTFIDRPKVAYVFGGMRSQNTDAEWLDMRQAVISEGFIRLGNASGRQDLMERGVAAGRASLSLLTDARTQANNYPMANLAASSGRPNVSQFLEPENVDHEGLPQLPARSGPDWGEVGGLAAIAFARHRFGGAFMDARRGLCIGIDGVTLSACTANATTVRMDMRSVMGGSSLPKAPWSEAFEVTLKVEGLEAARSYQLYVSGRECGSHSGTQMAEGVSVMQDSGNA